MMNQKAIAEQIFLAGVDSVLPEKLIIKSMRMEEGCLTIGNHDFSLNKLRNIYVIGAGKASAMMAAEVEKIIGKKITEGHIVVKYGHSCKLKYIITTEANHPVPDSNGFKATEEILRIADKAEEDDLVICLISGGGSALLADFPDGSSPEEMVAINDILINSGACIKEINAVRKHLSLVKGGHLARRVYPATLVSLILSDVAGDSMDVIASGPTVPDTTTFHQALDVLKRFDLIKSTPKGIVEYLNEGEAGIRPETPKPGDPVFEKVYNLLVGTNRLALEAACQKALEYNINPIIIDDKLQGDTNSVAAFIVETSLKYKANKSEVKPVCLLFGGETTIKMTGKCKGGRNQHLALLCAGMLREHHGVTILSAGTDGNDGPTNAAGAVVDSDTEPDALLNNMNPSEYLKRFDSYNFFKKAGGHIITGPTMTNVMDIIVVLITEE